MEAEIKNFIGNFSDRIVVKSLFILGNFFYVSQYMMIICKFLTSWDC